MASSYFKNSNYNYNNPRFNSFGRDNGRPGKIEAYGVFNFNNNPCRRHKKCKEVMETVCEEVPRLVHEEVMETVCEEVMETVHENVMETVCEEVPRVVCREVMETVTREVPRTVTRQVPRTVTRQVPRTVTKEVMEKVYRQVPRVVCKDECDDDFDSFRDRDCDRPRDFDSFRDRGYIRDLDHHRDHEWVRNSDHHRNWNGQDGLLGGDGVTRDGARNGNGIRLSNDFQNYEQERIRQERQRLVNRIASRPLGSQGVYNENDIIRRERERISNRHHGSIGPNRRYYKDGYASFSNNCDC